MNLQMYHKINIKTKLIQVFVFIFFLNALNSNVKAQEQKFVVVLDAGHGGHDPGNIGYKKYVEKDISLNIVLKVGELLENTGDIKVIYTRKTDVFVNLWERGKIANRADADLFVSVHCNAHSSQASGAENWALGPTNKKNLEIAKKENEVVLLEDNYKENYDGFNPSKPESLIGISMLVEEYLDQSLLLASLIQDNFANKLKRKNRGVKQAGFVVLYQTYMPSILVETGFLSNKEEGAYLNSAKGQNAFAKSIADGIVEYVNQVSLNTVSSNYIDADYVKKEKNDIVFKTQIASSSKKIEVKSYNFKGLKNVERVSLGKFYKYYYGYTSSYEEAIQNHKLAKDKGYEDSFIVAFKDGHKISVKEALKSVD